MAKALRLCFGFQNGFGFQASIQFPNVASRSPLYGRNPNHILIRRFLKSAKSVLAKHGRIVITVVNSSYYDGVFAMEDAAKRAGFQAPKAFPFFMSDFPHYKHVRTDNEGDSPISTKDELVTFVFTL